MPKKSGKKRAAELQSKVEQLSHANDDMRNLLNGTDVAMVFVDEDSCLKRYTERARKLIKLIPTDVGRPISDLVTKVPGRALDQQLSKGQVKVKDLDLVHDSTRKSRRKFRLEINRLEQELGAQEMIVVGMVELEQR